MSQYTPQAGHLFYVKFNPRERILAGDFGAADRVVKVNDGSYRDQIFRCMAHDETHVVAIREYGGFSNGSTYLFVREDVTFNPVGPDVVKALGLNVESQG